MRIKPKVVVCIRGGACTCVYADRPITVVLSDADNLLADGLNELQIAEKFKKQIKGLDYIY